MSSVVRRFKAVVVAVLSVSLLVTVASPTKTSATASEAIAGSFAAAAQKTFGTGNNHKCAIASDGSIKCWGDNSVAQLGQGESIVDEANPTELNAADNTPASAPVTVTGLSGKTF